MGLKLGEEGEAGEDARLGLHLQAESVPGP
jgi:hypothetical protein